MSKDNSILAHVDRIVFFQEENAWAVIRASNESKSFTAVGYLLGVREGEDLKLTGQWVEDPKFGRQFRVSSYLPVQPTSVEGIQKYLSSGLIDGVGPVMAERIIEAFGKETLEVIENNPERLREIEGIGKKRQEQIASSWTEMKHVREIVVFLHSHHISISHAAKIYQQYGQQAVAMVRSNPYQLAHDIRGIGFATADKVAKSLGFEANSPYRVAAGVLHLLREHSSEGHIFCPYEALFNNTTELLQIGKPIFDQVLRTLSTQTRIIIEGNRVYLQPLHEAEYETAREACRIVSDVELNPLLDPEEAIRWAQKEANITLAPQQKEAVAAALSEKLLIITGGPGTGKTTVINSIIKVMKRSNKKVGLCAPTGRASKRLQEATQVEAKTIHRILEYNPQSNSFTRNYEEPLEFDVVIVDEYSMVDIELCRNLFSALSDDTQLILVGDIDQLPSVGPGDVLRDLMSAFPNKIIRLNQIFRQAETSLIVSNAHKINEGIEPTSATNANGDFFFIEKNDPLECLNTCVELVTRRIPKSFGLSPTKDIQVLSPMHRGVLGAMNLNDVLQKSINPRGDFLQKGGRLLRVNDKVMQLRNNYDRQVFNGDLGRIHSIDPEEKVMHVEFDQKLVVYPFSELDELSLAYACTIHKSQGSEFPAVVIPLHGQHYVMLRRRLLYTAVTRGKKLVCIVGSRSALQMAVKNSRAQPRFTSLKDRLATVEAG